MQYINKMTTGFMYSIITQLLIITKTHSVQRLEFGLQAVLTLAAGMFGHMFVSSKTLEDLQNGSNSMLSLFMAIHTRLSLEYFVTGRESAGRHGFPI